MKSFLILLLVVILSGQVCAMSNKDIDIHSEVFISEKTSPSFHRTFCAKLFTNPGCISYIECKKNHYKPCRVCNDKKLIARLDTEYEAYVAEQQRGEREAQARKIKSQQLQQERLAQQRIAREEREKKYAEEQRRKQEERTKREQQEIEREEARRDKHRQDIADINDICQRVVINFSVANNSGFDLPPNLFKVDKRIQGSLKFPVKKGRVDIVPVVRCTDESYIYQVSGDSKVSCLFPTYNINQHVTVVGRRFNTIATPIRFDDGKVSAIIDDLNLERSNGYLYSFMTFENRTNDFVSIKDIYVSFDGVVCQAFSEELVFSSNISVPPKNSLKKIVVFTSVESGGGLERVIRELKKTLTKDEMENNALNISVSARYDRLGVDSDRNPFHDEKLVRYSDLFGL
jgi:Skp family chaperone for outer membrane proteins